MENELEKIEEQLAVMYSDLANAIDEFGSNSEEVRLTIENIDRLTAVKTKYYVNPALAADDNKKWIAELVVKVVIGSIPLLVTGITLHQQHKNLTEVMLLETENRVLTKSGNMTVQQALSM